ncbi:MAG TPA: hypothetical protein VK908_01505 [Jiangellales bacterium]|nr:hypothetical protein [Jiangellales bacterium]
MNGDEEYEADPPEVTLPTEADPADAAEQGREVAPHEVEPPPEARYDVDPADAAEQSRIVELDEDDYR